LSIALEGVDDDAVRISSVGERARANQSVPVATPRKLRSAISHKLAKTGKAVRRPRITVANTATSGKTVLKPKSRSRRSRVCAPSRDVAAGS